MPNPKKASSPAYDRLVEQLTTNDPEVVVAAMFGMPCLKLSGKAFVGSFNGGAVFKLDEVARNKALKLAGSELFDPSGKGRPMKEWVVVASTYVKQWPAFAKAAIEYVTR